MSIALVIAGLLFLILIHELGHFLVAKAVGAKATKFYVGFPPPLIRKQHGETEYGVGTIPLGGYVRIVGMTRPQPTDLWRVNDAVEEAAGRRDPDAPDQFGTAVADLRMRVDRQDLDGVAPSARTALLALEEERELLDPRTAAEARKDLDRLAEEADPRAYWRLDVWRRVAIIAAGPMANLLAALVILTLYFAHGTPVVDISSNVESVNSGTPAAAAGLQSGDRIVAVDGRPVEAADVRPAIQAANGAPLTLTVERDGQEVVLDPVSAEQSADGWLLGFRFDTERVGTRSYGWGSIEKSVSTIGDVTRADAVGPEQRGLRGREPRAAVDARRHRRPGLGDRAGGDVPGRAGADLAGARDLQPAAVPAARRRAHPVRRPGEGARRAADLARRVRARVRRRHRAHARALPHRLHQRHRSDPGPVTRRLAVVAALLVVAVGATPAHADRATKATVIGGTLNGDVLGGVALTPGGDWVTAWGPRGAGAVRVVRRTAGGNETRVVASGLRGLQGVDVELERDGRATGRLGRPDGRLDGCAPFVDGAVPFQVSAAPGQGARIVRLADGRSVITAAVQSGTRSDLLLAVGDGVTWSVRTLRNGPRQQPYTTFDLAATTGAGIAMLRTERGRLRLETLADAAGTGTPSVVDLGIARAGNGRLFSRGDGVLHVLYGGLPSGATNGTLRYGTLGTGGRFGRRVLLRNLQCDPGGYQIGVGMVGEKVRLLYGYGCDVGWSVTTVTGRGVLDLVPTVPEAVRACRRTSRARPAAGSRSSARRPRASSPCSSSRRSRAQRRSRALRQRVGGLPVGRRLVAVALRIRVVAVGHREVHVVAVRETVDHLLGGLLRLGAEALATLVIANHEALGRHLDPSIGARSPHAGR